MQEETKFFIKLTDIAGDTGRLLSIPAFLRVISREKQSA